MLLTISTTHQPATDLGYLLHKNPARLQTEELSLGKGYVFYPDASDDHCTAALLVEIDPVALVRGRGPAGEGVQLEQYVNDRPYAANSFLSVALGRIFSTAMSERSKDRPELAETAIPLTAHLPVIATRGGEDLVRRLFEPLGYAVELKASQLDDKFPEWGESPYVSLTISGTGRLQELLNLLEHPDEAFAFYRREGINTVVCEQKHMGSRAVVVLCKDETVSQKRFGVVQASLGTVYTRTGRRFFADEALEHQFLVRLQLAVEKSGLWDELATDWLCLDCELMPWSAKAQELLQKQYAPVGNAGVRALQAEEDFIAKAMLRVPGLESLAAQTTERLEAVEHYTYAYRQYCWPVRSLADLKLAPFHVLASEGSVHTGKPHTWHMEMIGRLCEVDTEILLSTPFKIVDLHDEPSAADAVAWWTEMTAQGREGMVVKPLNFIAEGRRGITQPAMKCRGAEYLRIIYGPEYLLPANLERLRSRNVGAKRSLASREFALGIEALERFVRKDPLRLTHECVFGVLALESELIDPRL